NLIVLELEELKAKGQLCFVVLLILMLKITQEMYLGDRSQKKICIIDEAWDLIGKGNSGSFIETGYRRARKYGGAFLTATQSTDDYYMSNNTQACWNNADIKFLLRQGSEPKNVKFDEYTSNLMKTVSTETGVFSEVLIIIGSQTCGVCRLIVDPFSAFIYSSNANDVQLINYIKQFEGLPVEQAVRKAIKLSQQTMKQLGVSRDNVSNLLIQQIKKNGYDSLNKFVEVN
ncbi:MAG: ATP-binding protein, partial [Burkholderiales bacterium]|nr:ATP-binding protein [Burkholderiales bacterium]